METPINPHDIWYVPNGIKVIPALVGFICANWAGFMEKAAREAENK